MFYPTAKLESSMTSMCQKIQTLFRHHRFYHCFKEFYGPKSLKVVKDIYSYILGLTFFFCSHTSMIINIHHWDSFP